MLGYNWIHKLSDEELDDKIWKYNRESEEIRFGLKKVSKKEDKKTHKVFKYLIQEKNKRVNTK